jgi:hypothetical protein
MDQRTLKDLRVIAPYWAAQSVLIFATVAVLRHSEPVKILIVMYIGIYLLANLIACAPFASERSDNTLHRLMSEPEGRPSLWRRKLFVIAAALGLNCLAAFLVWAFWQFLPTPARTNLGVAKEVADVFVGATFGVVLAASVAAFGTGLLMPILIPQAFTSLMASLVAPITIVSVAGILVSWLEHHLNITIVHHPYLSLLAAICVYCVICLIISFKKFCRMEIN